jgi:hypothetical protein
MPARHGCGKQKQACRFSSRLGSFGVAPTDGVADRVLASRLMQVRDPAQRTPAMQALGAGRAASALRLRPVQEDAYGQLFEIGPREAPSIFLFVRDRVLDSGGSALTHWTGVPPHVATAHEAVAWTFGMSEASYRPTQENVARARAINRVDVSLAAEQRAGR